MKNTTINTHFYVKDDSLNWVEIPEAYGVDSATGAKIRIDETAFSDTVIKRRAGKDDAGNLTVNYNMRLDSVVQSFLRSKAGQIGTAGILDFKYVTNDPGSVNTLYYTGWILNIQEAGEVNDAYRGVMNIRLRSHSKGANDE